MVKGKRTAHDELARLREQAAAERVKQPALANELEAARPRTEHAEQAIGAEYEREDRDAIDAGRAALMPPPPTSTTSAAVTTQPAPAAAPPGHDRRVHREPRRRAHPGAGGPRGPDHPRVADAVAGTLKLHHRLLDQRAQIDTLVTGVGGNPRLDGPHGQHSWEHALVNLDRVVRSHPDLAPPSPRWLGRRHADERDRVARHLHAQREGQAAVERLREGPW